MLKDGDTNMQKVDFPDLDTLKKISSSVGPERVFEAFRKNITENDSRINSFTTVLEYAERKKDPLSEASENAGIPFSVKDMIDTKGVVTSYGSPIFEKNVPRRDAGIVNSLLDKGFLLQGKTVTHEFAMGIVTPKCRNPWNLECIAGGSSGGSAAAVSALFSPFSLGTDTAGSVRIPAAMCGVTGLKTSSGSLSMSGIFPEAPSLDTVGVISRHSSDIPAILESMGMKPVPVQMGGPLVGLIIRELFEHARGDVRSTLRSFMDRMASEGIMEITELSLPELAEISRYDDIMDNAENYHVHQELFRVNSSSYSELSRKQLENAARIPADEYLKAKKMRTSWKIKVHRILKGPNVLLSPTIPRTAPFHSELGNRDPGYFMQFMSHTNIFNFSGNPALTLPAGLAGGMPIGLQIASPLYTDVELCNLGARIQKSSDFHLNTPFWCAREFRSHVGPILQA